MAYEIRIQHQVEFVETDMAGMVHFCHFFRWMEAAECRFFKELNLPLAELRGNQFHGWPRVKVSCQYRAPLFFGEDVEVRLIVKKLEAQAIHYAFRFYRIDTVGFSLVATGEMTTLYATRTLDGRWPLQTKPFPPAIWEFIQEAPPAALFID